MEHPSGHDRGQGNANTDGDINEKDRITLQIKQSYRRFALASQGFVVLILIWGYYMNRHLFEYIDKPVLFGTFFILLIVFAGLFSFLYQNRLRVVIDREGITRDDLLGSQTQTYDELDKVAFFIDTWGIFAQYRLVFQKRAAIIPTNYEGLEEAAAFLQQLRDDQGLDLQILVDGEEV